MTDLAIAPAGPAVPDPSVCCNEGCTNPRPFRNGISGSRVGAHGQCRSCTARSSYEAAGGDPYTGPRWYEQEPAPRGGRVPLKSGWSGYGRAA